MMESQANTFSFNVKAGIQLVYMLASKDVEIENV